MRISSLKIYFFYILTSVYSYIIEKKGKEQENKCRKMMICSLKVFL